MYAHIYTYPHMHIYRHTCIHAHTHIHALLVVQEHCRISADTWRDLVICPYWVCQLTVPNCAVCSPPDSTGHMLNLPHPLPLPPVSLPSLHIKKCEQSHWLESTTPVTVSAWRDCSALRWLMNHSITSNECSVCWYIRSYVAIVITSP